ncbi:MAG: hypothetical protein KatS3mg067_0154 [Thermosynechococcus sp.]|uniref:hypothetical protein n=1 Tax=Thermosynechococcus sp. TaxID=2814275 RepID=UPI0022091B03|nr:hypothetical protein [Thermosynechococcus sp.]BCX11216.1 MAG: hypothetical protein KatS3mg067_0154 [Thermosynechococcus sp.]
MNSSQAVRLFLSLGLATTLASCQTPNAGGEEGGTSYRGPSVPGASATAVTGKPAGGFSIYLMAERGERGEHGERGECGERGERGEYGERGRYRFWQS